MRLCSNLRHQAKRFPSDQRWSALSWRSLSLCVLLTLLLPFYAGCSGSGSGSPSPGSGPRPDANPRLPPSVSIAPENTGDGWPTSTPDAEGMDAQGLLANVQSIENYPGVDSVVVARNGKLVAEAYFNGYGRDTLHDVRSASKSITSALAGIAADQGLLTTEDTLADSIYQLDGYDNWDARKGSIKLIDLLHMSSGLACDDWVASSPGNEERMYRTADWLKFVLDLPMIGNPGERSSYCTGGVILLGSIVANRSGMHLDEFAATYLFNPLGIQTVEWRRSPDGRATGGGGMRLKPRDAAKFGSLYLDGGMWLGTRVLPESWVVQSQQRVTTLGADAYGLLWWKRSFFVRGAQQECVFASGNGGNFIFVLPSERMVVVFTGSNYNSRLGNQPFELLPEKILSALR